MKHNQLVEAWELFFYAVAVRDAACSKRKTVVIKVLDDARMFGEAMAQIKTKAKMFKVPCGTECRIYVRAFLHLRGHTVYKPAEVAYFKDVGILQVMVKALA